MRYDYRIRHVTTSRAHVGSSRDDAVVIRVNNRAATRASILDACKANGLAVHERSDWDAIALRDSVQRDWDYHSIAIHHAGNSASCGIPGVDQLKAIDRLHNSGDKKHLGYHYAVDCRGAVYEALDIRFKGRHVEGGNSHVIGIVLMADLSERGEGADHSPEITPFLRAGEFRKAIVEMLGRGRDRVDLFNDRLVKRQIDATAQLCRVLKGHFEVKHLGGHREYAAMHGSDRECPGRLGLTIVEQLRHQLSLLKPS